MEDVIGRRIRGLSLGFLLVAVNILLVAGLVLVTSNRSVSDLLNPDDELTVQPTVTDVPTTSTPQPTTPMATETVEEVDQVALLKERFERGESLNVVILGDQTGTHSNDWVGAWVRELAQERPVEYRVPTVEDPTRYAPPVTVGEVAESAESGKISVRNASIVGATPRYAAPRVALFVPPDTDVVLLSYGRSNTWLDIKNDLDALHTELIAEAPNVLIRVVVQPPRQDGETTLDAEVRDWSSANGLEAIDVGAVFTEENLLVETVSNRDPLSVNIRGGQIWARIVQEELFGPLESWAGETEPAEVAVVPGASLPEQPVATVEPAPPVRPAPPRNSAPPQRPTTSSPRPAPSTTSPSAPAPTSDTPTTVPPPPPPPETSSPPEEPDPEPPPPEIPDDPESTDPPIDESAP